MRHVSLFFILGTERTDVGNIGFLFVGAIAVVSSKCSQGNICIRITGAVNGALSLIIEGSVTSGFVQADKEDRR